MLLPPYRTTLLLGIQANLTQVMRSFLLPKAVTVKTAILSAFLILGTLAAAGAGWIQTYNGAPWGPAFSVAPTSGGEYVIAGHCRSNLLGQPDSSAYAFKISSGGAILWVKSYARGAINSIISTPDGGFVAAGWTCSYALGDTEAYVLKLNSTGDTLWTRTYGGPGQDVARCVSLAYGGYIIAGYTNSFGSGNSDLWVLKLNIHGDTLWTRTYGGAEADWANSVIRTSDGGYALAGCTESFGSGWGDVWILKLNASGDTLWTRTYGGEFADEGKGIVQTPDSGYAVAGYTNSFGSGYDDAWVLRLNAGGDTLWTRTYGGILGDRANSIITTPNGKYLIAGYTNSFGTGRHDIWVLKLNESGDSLWANTYGWSDTWDRAMCLTTTSDGGCLVAGYQTYNADTGLGHIAVIIKIDSLNALSIATGKAENSTTSRLAASHHADKLNLRINLPKSAHVRLDLLNSLGEAISTIADQALPVGESRLEVLCPKVPAGIYLIRSNGVLPTARVVVW